VDEMSGGSMSLSNLGGIGGTYFTPIVNWPEAAILGRVARRHRAGVEDGQFVPRQMLPLSLVV
jgi:pyruvate dehydrogenase E2 component (dihydrolipoamide acetyltransferase)